MKSFSFSNAGRDFDIVAAGSLIRLKQYDVFVQVIAELKKAFPKIKAVLIGDGPEKSRLQTLIRLLGLESNITLTGELSHPKVLQWMQRGKLFLHPSSYEGFGVVCIEALCAGTEVISFVKPMHAEIQNWHIVTNKAKMVEKAADILNAPKTNYERVIPFTIDESVQKMSKLFSF